MSSVVSGWQRYKLPVVMGGILVSGHLAWRWLQNQTEFVPKGEEIHWSCLS
jgi:hypothetical protein